MHCGGRTTTDIVQAFNTTYQMDSESRKRTIRISRTSLCLSGAALEDYWRLLLDRVSGSEGLGRTRKRASKLIGMARDGDLGLGLEILPLSPISSRSGFFNEKRSNRGVFDRARSLWCTFRRVFIWR